MGDAQMTADEARKIMPITTDLMTDSEIEALINNLNLIADAYIETVRFDNMCRVNIEYTRDNTNN